MAEAWTQSRPPLSLSSYNNDYVLDATTASVRLAGPGVAARVIYSAKSLPSQTSGQHHMLLEVGDHLGSTSVVLDHETSELVEYATYQAYGGADSSYRPARWDSVRESYRFRAITSAKKTLPLKSVHWVRKLPSDA